MPAPIAGVAGGTCAKQRELSTMNSTLTTDIDLETLREDLLEFTPMCYGVAFQLTRDAALARQLTEEVLLWAWRNPEAACGDAGLKMGLLSRLRSRFRAAYRQPALKFALRKPFLLSEAYSALRNAS